MLQSFPHKIGAARICTTAWHQAVGAADAGAAVTVAAGVVHRPLPGTVQVQTTLSRGTLRLPYSVVGTDRALALHDRLVARRLPKLRDQFDVVHVWPLAAAETLRTAKRLGIPTVLERPNAHTKFAYEVVARECQRLGVSLPADHEHAFNKQRLALEEREYALADYLLCPSEFVASSFVAEGFPRAKLLRHGYGYDDKRFTPSETVGRQTHSGLSALFVGVCAVRKGLHFALDAWLRSSASATGTFTIVGAFIPDYQQLLAPQLSHPNVRVLGHQDNIPEIMRQHDVLVLPSIEEGSPLVCMEGVGCGLVPLVSDVCSELAMSGNALVHPVGDVKALARHFSMLHEDRALLEELHKRSLTVAPSFTWERAGRRLVTAYEQAARQRP